MARYALLKSQTIQNICEWDGDTTKWSPPEGLEAIASADQWQVGGSVIDGVYSPPPDAPPPETVTLRRWLAQLHTRSQRIAWSRAQEMSRQLAMGSPDLDGETVETLAALETVGEWFMVAQVTGEVTLADDAIYQAGLTLGVYASQSDVDRIKSDTAP